MSNGELRIKAFRHSKNSRNHDKINLLGELERRIMPSHDLWQKGRNSSKIRVREDIKCDKYGKGMANIPPPPSPPQKHFIENYNYKPYIYNFVYKLS